MHNGQPKEVRILYRLCSFGWPCYSSAVNRRKSACVDKSLQAENSFTIVMGCVVAELDVRAMYAKWQGQVIATGLDYRYGTPPVFEGSYPTSVYEAFLKFENLLLVLDKDGTMARKKNTAQQSFQQVEFINIPLTEAQEDEFDAWVKKNEATWHDKVSDMQGNMYKFGMSFDSQNASFIVSVTCKDEQDENFNKCFTARSDSWIEALQIAVFKHYVVCKETWQDNQKKRIRG